MTLKRIAAAASLALLMGVTSASAQEFRGFASAGVSSDPNQEQYPAFGGGVLVDIGQRWVSAGVQGETLISWPYVNGRLAVFGQGNLTPGKRITPFVLAGAGIGEYSGGFLGGGVEIRPAGQRLGFRVAFEDYLTRYRKYDGSMTHHQVGLRVGVLF
jgi:hypothetical protein